MNHIERKEQLDNCKKKLEECEKKRDELVDGMLGTFLTVIGVEENLKGNLLEKLKDRERKSDELRSSIVKKLNALLKKYG